MNSNTNFCTGAGPTYVSTHPETRRSATYDYSFLQNYLHPPPSNPLSNPLTSPMNPATSMLPTTAISTLRPSSIPLTDLAPLGPPLPEAAYSDYDALYIAVQSHARANGFAVSKSSSTATRKTIRCAKGGAYDPKGKKPELHESKRRKRTASMKTGCPYALTAHRLPNMQWKVSTVNGNHNHGPAVSEAVFPQHRKAILTAEKKKMIVDMDRVGIRPQLILNFLRENDQNCCLVHKDIANLLASARRSSESKPKT